MANGEQCKVAGIFSALTRLCNRTRVIDLMVVPELVHDVILDENESEGLGSELLPTQPRTIVRE